MKDVINVEINTGTLSQFFGLPREYIYGGTTFKLNCVDALSPVTILNGRCTHPFDLRLTQYVQNSMTVPWLCKISRSAALPRSTKNLQQCVLTALVDEINEESPLKYFEGLNPTEITSTGPSSIFFGDRSDNDMQVIKPSSGARSMCIMKLSQRKTNLREFISLLRRLLIDTNSTTEDLKTLCDNFEVSLDLGDERETDEGLDQMKNYPLLITDMVTAPFKEYRVLVSPGRTLVVHRDHQDGSINLLDTPVESFHHAKEVNDEIGLVLSRIQKYLGLGSVDVWVTSSGEWGIFEFQPQYGCVHLEESIHQDFLKEAIYNICLELGL